MLVFLDILFQNWLILHKIVQFRYLLLKYRLTDLHIVVKSGIFFLKLQETKISSIIIIQNIRSVNIINLRKHSTHSSFGRFNLNIQFILSSSCSHSYLNIFLRIEYFYITFNSKRNNLRRGMDHVESRGVKILVDCKTTSF